MKANQDLGREKTTLAGVREGFRSMPVDVETTAPSGAQSAIHERDTRPTEGLNPKKKILIVDDDHRNVKLLAGKLPANDFESISAYEGKSALEAAQKEAPDLILLDVLMPGMDGYEVTRKLKSNPDTQDIPIILVTALDGLEEKTKGLKAGADEFLSKPVHYAELLTRVRSLIRLKEYKEKIEQTNRSQESSMKSKMPTEMASEKEDTPSILLIEDDKKNAGFIRNCLNGHKCKLHWVRGWKDAVALLSQEKKDLLILSLPLPGLDGLKLCKRLKGLENTKSIQIMVLSSQNDSATSAGSKDYGADDFMIKPFKKEEFIARINVLLKMKSDAGRLNGPPQTSVCEIITDKQSGLYERSFFMHQLDLEIKRSLRRKHSLALVMINIRLSEMDDDKGGQLTVDEILNLYGKLVNGCIRDEDLATYFRDNEFALALPFLERNNAVNIAKRIHKAIIDYDVFPRESSNSPAVTASLGIAFCPSDACTAEQLIQKADAALGRTKSEGQDGICMWEESSTTEN